MSDHHQLSLDLEPERTWVADWLDDLLAEPVEQIEPDPAWKRAQGAARAEEYSLWLDRRRRAELRADGSSVKDIIRLEKSGWSKPYSER